MNKTYLEIIDSSIWGIEEHSRYSVSAYYKARKTFLGYLKENDEFDQSETDNKKYFNSRRNIIRYLKTRFPDLKPIKNPLHTTRGNCFATQIAILIKNRAERRRKNPFEPTYKGRKLSDILASIKARREHAIPAFPNSPPAQFRATFKRRKIR